MCVNVIFPVIRDGGRPDVAEAPLDREVALSQAPRRTETGFLVPSPQA